MEDYLRGSLNEKPDFDICHDGMSPIFASKIALVCDEIRENYEIEESVRSPGTDDLLEFLYDLSAFLLELECPHEELCCGPIENRFSSVQSCEKLLKFLLSELKASRLYLHQRLESGDYVKENKDKELTPIITSAIESINMPKPSGNVNEYHLLDSFRANVERRLSSCKFQPLFKASLDEKTIGEIEKLAEQFQRDFNNRILLLSRRLKVTVESFLWCDRIKPNAEKIRSILSNCLEDIGSMKSNCDIPHLLSASTSLLNIQKASAPEKRENSKTIVHPLSCGEAPKDRGGRTSEMVGLPTETFRSQNNNFNNQRGGHRGGGRGHFRGNQGRGRGGFQSHEQRILQDHQASFHQQRGGYRRY